MFFFLLAVIKLGTESKSAVKFINVPHRLSRFFFKFPLSRCLMCLQGAPRPVIYHPPYCTGQHVCLIGFRVELWLKKIDANLQDRVCKAKKWNKNTSKKVPEA